MNLIDIIMIAIMINLTFSGFAVLGLTSERFTYTNINLTDNPNVGIRGDINFDDDGRIFCDMSLPRRQISLACRIQDFVNTEKLAPAAVEGGDAGKFKLFDNDFIKAINFFISVFSDAILVPSKTFMDVANSNSMISGSSSACQANPLSDICTGKSNFQVIASFIDFIMYMFYGLAFIQLLGGRNFNDMKG